MVWTDLHAAILGNAFSKVLGKGELGSMAFVRCLTTDVVEAIAQDATFAPAGWQVFRVADIDDPRLARTITADRAVEMREAKGNAVLLLVDTARAGAGMDGIYSAAREIDEAALFHEALRLAASEITTRMSRGMRDYAERALKKARAYGRRFSVSLWTEFDFLVRIAADRIIPGDLLYLLGLWPIQGTDPAKGEDGLDMSRMFVDRLLGTAVSGLTPARRIEGLKLLNPSEEQIRDLELFLRSAATKPLIPALADLADKKHLWVNAVKVEEAAKAIQGIELIPWRTNTGAVAKWSGLIEQSDTVEPPALLLRPDAEVTGEYCKLEVRWKARPENLEKGAVEYRVTILTDMEEELASREVAHSAKKEEKCRFSDDDFSTLSEDALISAKVVLTVIGDAVDRQESEEFVIRFGQPPEREQGGVGKKVRTFSEGLIELEDREVVTDLVDSAISLHADPKSGFVPMRTPQRGKSFRVYRPPLIHEVESEWIKLSGQVGRWRVKVRASGARAGTAEFVPFPPNGAAVESNWDRVVSASRRMAERFETCGGGVGQVYDEKSKVFDNAVKEYVLAWAALLDDGEPSLALANTVEVQTLSGRTIGLIVLPSHPLRVAWHAAYDNLVLHAAFDQSMPPKQIREEFSFLDGAMFPPFLPGLESGYSFVYADTLGFHAVGMVADSDKEPKAAVAILARALGENEMADTVPTVGNQSAQVLASEILKYLECHDTPRLLHVHALRAGDGLTVARSLGRVYESYRRDSDDDDLDMGLETNAPAYVLELYPSLEQRGIAGRFIAEAREKRRSGAGVLSPDDQWMLESLSLPNGVTLPRLRWARKTDQDPKTAAHLAVAFDTFESRVVPQRSDRAETPTRPLYAFGLLSFFERDFSSVPAPLWRSVVPAPNEGEKHPSDRTHSERLARIHQVVQRCVGRTLGEHKSLPSLRTEISAEKAQSLREIHRLCDWVITLDRNAGIEYFDSPRDNKDIYEAYVIDCVPEREDLGCLQLITSTSNLEEVRNLLDGALDQMGLSHSRRNAEFLMEHLKALSGRLAIRLTGRRAPTSELIALALSHANCRDALDGTVCWVPLTTGFIVPVDDVRDVLPPLSEQDRVDEEKEGRPDLLYVSVVPRKGLLFRFVEVKYRRHLRVARSPETLQGIRAQVESLRKRWDTWYADEAICSSFRATRRAKLARVLRFYADKARRHYLPEDQYRMLVSEIDRMVEKGGEYSIPRMEGGDRGWIFCPEFTGTNPLKVSPDDWETQIFLFGPIVLPDSDLRFDATVRPVEGGPTDAATKAAPKEAAQHIIAETEPTPPQTDVSTNDAALESTPSSDASTAGAGDDAPSVRFGNDLLTGAEVKWSLTIKGNPHLLIAGLPGMGKTTCLLNLCKQMLDVGIRPIVFSYHQDIDERLAQLVDGIRFIDFRGLGFNPLQVIDRQSRMAYLDVAGALRDIFVAVFPELGDIQGERVRKAIKDSFIEKGWSDPNAAMSDLVEPDFGRFVEILRADPKPDRGLRTLLARLEELGDYGFFESTDARESLWEAEQAIVIRIHTTQNDNLQKAFASLIFYGLYKDMFRRGLQQRITHALVFDEAHRAAKLALIPTMAKECRKYGVSLVLASQEAKDFNVSLFSAIANYLVLRLTEVDAKALVRNVASSDQERVLIDRIKQMERFKALYFCEGKKRPSPVSLLP